MQQKYFGNIPIYYVDKLPGKFRGMTLPPFGIFILKKHKGDSKILLHDYIHWCQYHKMGFLDFYLSYIIQYIFIGYDKMKMEQEARKLESDYIKRHYRKIYHK